MSLSGKDLKIARTGKRVNILEHTYSTVWLTFMINYVIILLFIARFNYNIAPVVLVMEGSATFTSGTIIKLSSLKWEAVFIWLMLVAAFLVPLSYPLLATAAAVSGGYLIIHGYMLKNSEV